MYVKIDMGFNRVRHSYGNTGGFERINHFRHHSGFFSSATTPVNEFWQAILGILQIMDLGGHHSEYISPSLSFSSPLLRESGYVSGEGILGEKKEAGQMVNVSRLQNDIYLPQRKNPKSLVLLM
ncbi:hypothetical protein PIROE2DRAFT_2193 [Piromyces sp. E2]|nr:hypothetical protein PIROE2DRAFT_2193 [Piromyces sp. E2]|eukprot:OUM69771.1 hypothetical protein PIROE2DRAFT_2193 [Piromyces sp. E2]